MNKKLFSALALTVALAACTKDEELLLPTGNGNDAMLANRPLIGNVEIVTGSATRADVVDDTWGKLAYQTGDAIGAVLVDEPNLADQTGYAYKKNATPEWQSATWTYANYVNDVPKKIHGTDYLFTQTKSSEGGSASHPSAYYTVVDNKVYTNYGYTYNGASWTTEAELVEGHYMFYFPYNANNSARLPINVEIPQTQGCTDGNSAIDAFYDGTSPVTVDLQFIAKPAAGEKATVAATPEHLFAYPQFTIKNDFNGYIYNAVDDGTQVLQNESKMATTTAPVKTTMTINKIELIDVGANLWTKGTIQPTTLKEKVNAGWTANKYRTASYTSHVVTSTLQSSYDQDHALVPYADVANPDALTQIDKENVLVFNVNKELAYGEQYEFNAIMPAADYGEGQLFARVYVTIEGNQYLMMYAANEWVDEDFNVAIAPEDKYAIGATSVTGIYTIAEGKNIELVRGERYPIIEYNVDKNGTPSKKANAGSMLTISLNGMTAFEVGTFTATSSTRGFETETQFMEFIANVTRGEALEEVANDDNTPMTEHQFALKNNLTLDADLVEYIYEGVDYKTMDAHLILNHHNLAIANNVAVSETFTLGTGELAEYHIYTLTGNGKSIKVAYKPATINTDAEKLVSGINEISDADKTLNKKDDSEDAGLGIVFLNANAKIRGGANSFRILVPSGVTLTVENNSSAQITSKSGSSIFLKANLTNTENKFENGTDITNNTNSMFTLAGNVNNNQVKATLKAWPTSVPVESKVNNITINPANSETTVIVEQANFNVFLANTTITLGDNVAGLLSTANVNLKSVAGKVKVLDLNSKVWDGDGLVVTAKTGQVANAGSGTIKINFE